MKRIQTISLLILGSFLAAGSMLAYWKTVSPGFQVNTETGERRADPDFVWTARMFD